MRIHRMMHTNTCERAVIQMLLEMTPKEAFLLQLHLLLLTPRQ